MKGKTKKMKRERERENENYSKRESINDKETIEDILSRVKRVLRLIRKAI